jgi:hypothetical protein
VLVGVGEGVEFGLEGVVFLKKDFTLVIRILVVVLVSVYFYECCAVLFVVQSESVSESQLSSQSPAPIQPPNGSLADDSSTSVQSDDNLASGDSLAIPPDDSPSAGSSLSVSPDGNLPTGSPVSVPSNDSVATGSQVSVEYDGQENSSQLASSVRLGVYGSDPSVGQPEALQAIDWCAFGSLVPGQSVNSSVAFLWNEGEVPIGLSLSATDWVFKNSSGSVLSQSYQQYFSLRWDYDGSVLGVGEVRAVTFTLAISSKIVDVVTFSFRLVVTGTY